MRAVTLVRWGLFALLAAVVLPVLNLGLKLFEEQRLESLVGWLLRGAGVLLTAAVGLWVLEKVGLRVSGARCRDCRRRVPHGHAYCLDHLRDRTYRAQEKYHGTRGMGV